MSWQQSVCQWELRCRRGQAVLQGRLRPETSHQKSALRKLPLGRDNRNPSAPPAPMVFHQFFQMRKLIPSPKVLFFWAERDAVSTHGSGYRDSCKALGSGSYLEREKWLLWKGLSSPDCKKDCSCFLSLTYSTRLCCHPTRLLHMPPLCGFFRH